MTGFREGWRDAAGRARRADDDAESSAFAHAVARARNRVVGIRRPGLKRTGSRGDAVKVCYAEGPVQPAGTTVTRLLLDESRVHPAIRDRIAGEGRAVIAEVEAAIAANKIVVVGMGLNPFPRKARQWLDAAGVPYKYLGYGSYFSAWRTRLPLKLWTGWTTFPMVFVDGQFIGGYQDLARLDAATLKKGTGAASARA
jgi:glutaredoxin-related protein